MSQPNAWQTANRNRNSQSASRTPQNRSGTASPNPTASTQPPKQQENNRQPPSNPWTQRSSTPASGSNGPRAGDLNAAPSVNNFNASAVKSFLARDAAPAAYKPQDAPDANRGSGSAWGAKTNQMANGQSFFLHLAKQVATTEGGG